VIKGERRLEKLKPKQTTFNFSMPIAAREIENGKEAENIVGEDDRYHTWRTFLNKYNE
jgi:hypothetical protein